MEFVSSGRFFLTRVFLPAIFSCQEKPHGQHKTGISPVLSGEILRTEGTRFAAGYSLNITCSCKLPVQ